MGLNYILHIAQKNKKFILTIIFLCTLVSIILANMIEEKWTSSAQVRHSAEGYLGMLMSLRKEGSTENDEILYKKILEKMIDIASDADSKVSFLKRKQGEEITKDKANNRIYVSRDAYSLETYLFQLTADSPSNAQKWLREYIDEMNIHARDYLLQENKILITEEQKSLIRLFQYNYEPTYPVRKNGPHKGMLISVGFLSGIFFGFIFAILMDSKKQLRT